MKQGWSRARWAHAASIWLAWALWAVAYWRASWLVFGLSFVPYLLVNHYWHKLDPDDAAP